MSVSTGALAAIKWGMKKSKKKVAVKKTQVIKPKEFGKKIKAEITADAKAKQRLKAIKNRYKI